MSIRADAAGARRGFELSVVGAGSQDHDAAMANRERTLVVMHDFTFVRQVTKRMTNACEETVLGSAEVDEPGAVTAAVHVERFLEAGVGQFVEYRLLGTGVEHRHEAAVVVVEQAVDR